MNSDEEKELYSSASGLTKAVEKMNMKLKSQNTIVRVIASKSEENIGKFNKNTMKFNYLMERMTKDKRNIFIIFLITVIAILSVILYFM